MQAAAINGKGARAREGIKQVEGALLLAPLLGGAEARVRRRPQERGLRALVPRAADGYLRRAEGGVRIERKELGIELCREASVVQLDATTDI